MNLIDSLKAYFTPDTCTGIAQTLSESPETVGTATAAVIPTALISLIHQTSRPEGSQQVMNAVRDTDESVLSQGSELFTGSQAMSLMESGTKRMASVLGPGMSDNIVTSISKFSGLAPGSSRSLLGMVMPVVLAFLGKSAAGAGIHDASGLATYLQSQATSVAGAMPLGLKQHLSWMPSISSWIESPTGRERAWSGEAAQPAHAYSATTQTGAGFTRYVPLALLLIALGAIAWYLWPTAADRSVYNKPMVRQNQLTDQFTAQPAGAELTGTANRWFGDVTTLGDPTLGKELSTTFGDFGNALSDVRSNSDLDAAAAKLQEVQTRVGAWDKTFASLPPDRMAKVKEMMRNALPTLQSTMQKAMSVPGAQEKLGPTADKIMAKFRTYTEPAP